MLQKLSALVGVAVLAVACGRTDAGITTNVKSKLAADDTVKAYQINVDTRNGVVTLRGDVDSSLVKERAVQIARGTDGVRDVVDVITVTTSAPTGGFVGEHNEPAEARPGVAERARESAEWAEGIAADSAITTAVKARILADNALEGFEIHVDTNDHVVTLTGNVATRAEADRAVMAARRTEGVRRVVDNLRVGK